MMMPSKYGPTLEVSKNLHATKYRGDGESFEEAMNRLANALKDNDEHFKSFRSILMNMRFMPGGRIQSAIGSIRNVTPFNCFVSGTIEDSMDDIMHKAAEAAQTMRLGGGIGYDFSTLRPKGDRIISLDSRSSGPISFMDIFNSICHTISSAGHRRGAQMGVLRVDHPDIEEFIRCKQNTDRLTAFNVSVTVTDKFMECIESGEPFELVFDGRVYKTIDARNLWEEIMRSTWEWAEPGIIFIDRVNEYNNLHYCEVIATTNPCIHGDTLVETVHGRIKIKDMTTPMRVYCMDSSGGLTTAMASASWLSRQDALTIKITIDSGKQLICTPSHEIYTIDKGKVKAGELEVGDQVCHLCRTKKSEAYSRVKLNTEPMNSYRTEHRFVASESHGSLYDWDVHHKDGDTFNNNISNLEIIHHGTHSSISNIGTDKSDMARGDGGRFIEKKVKKPRATKQMPEELKSNLTNQYSGRIISIEVSADPVDVYDMSVETHHNYIANYIVVSNCAEQPLPPYGACLLGSFNLTKYIREDASVPFDAYMFDMSQLEADIPQVVRAMDNVIDIATYPLVEQEHEAKAKRRMGLGVTGVANAGEALGYEYGSDDFILWMNTVLEVIRDTAYESSIALAKEKGSFLLFNAKGFLSSEFAKTLPTRLRNRIRRHGIRNSHLLSIAPTGTISLSADNCSSGIEPVYCYEYDRIMQHADGPATETVVDYGKRVFGIEGKTTEQCSIDDHLNVLLAATKYVDSAVSKTCNVNPKMPWGEFKDVYMRAWKGGAKGITTFNAEGKRFGILIKKDEPQACFVDPITNIKTCE